MTSNRKARPAWLLRLTSAGLDISLITCCAAPLPKAIAFDPLFLMALMAAYYLGTELPFGRTPGKMLLRLHMLSNGEKPGPWKILVRTVARLISGPFLLLSWNRVTLGDFISGLRVFVTNAPADWKAGSKRARALPQPLGWR